MRATDEGIARTQAARSPMLAGVIPSSSCRLRPPPGFFSQERQPHFQQSEPANNGLQTPISNQLLQKKGNLSQHD